MGSIIPSVIGGLALFLIYNYIVLPAIISPLSKVPAAHWTCHFSPLWILITRQRRRENKTLYEAHRRHGPVVRIGPRDVSVDGVEGLRVVYQGGFEKHSWYSVFSNYGVPNMFSTLPSKLHSHRKRAVSNVYSKSFIQSSAAARAQTAHVLHARLLPVLQASSPASDTACAPYGIDAFPLFLASAMDLISAYVFGLAGGTDFLRQKAYRDHWLELYLARAGHGFWPQELPVLTSFSRRVLRFSPYPRWVDDANAELRAWNRQLCDAAKARAREASPTGETAVADEAVVLDALNASIDRQERTYGEASVLYSTSIQQRDTAVASEVMDHLLAGQETAGIALTYATWHLSRQPEIQDALRSELLALSPGVKIGTEEVPDPRVLDALPLLHAVVMETLRLHAPIPGPEPRRTPREGCRMAGFELPGDVRIAALGYTLHRDEEVFPEPEEWVPARWMEGKENAEQRREMLRRFWAFGSGGRMCIGSNFAMNEMKYILAAIYTNFKTFVVEDSGIEQEDAYTARPSGESLFLRFEPVQ